ncbi:hypothetical protein BAUCODRAFT_466821 [Baudoinia panamericana UAMH 10762]|uniref:Fe2OG dioxygenase domain-containing protein n=1 Tax=Baudoinia panamericana (strain UAMH 10762) TaxID=717646 RepID=M2NAN6_BAUPA|nr:uncharacterized protein BAUCODRAFT_466821 [Baudoinia panamericana UAMH 10762]EMC96204.1 hypothetical protein BAUCODRAFT_466821 [Baudoinia panamericana UAMH 10762]
MAATKYAQRTIPKISLANFDTRKDTIVREICSAAENVGFFAIVDHGISQPEIDHMFKASESFFALPDEVKATVPWNPQNVGYEHKSQIRPSTGAADQKESYQLQFGENMKGLWIGDEHLPSFKPDSLEFMHKVQAVSERLMVCLANGLGFEDDYFTKAHDVSRPDSQSTLRLLHYYATPRTNDGVIRHRAGAHADWGFLTLLFQKEGQSGLEICPGREVVTEFGHGDAWTKVEFGENAIICNIGDLLMSWSDDRFKSTFHRVKAPCEPDDYYGERYSIAFFNQPRKDTLIQGPKEKYSLVTGGQFTANAMQMYYAALKAKVEEAQRPVDVLKDTMPAAGIAAPVVQTVA